jgi:hypothetical protein
LVLHDSATPTADLSRDACSGGARLFDFEAMLKQIKTTDHAKKLQIISDHVPVPVSIFSNVQDYDDKPIFYAMINPMY